ncbi:helix-turn-helix domain-containing protein [Pseudalkalibacillus decolorationis]|uniref:helix-turn-helix domain-containing protein n=1 Tax=Pseudalkalibacillus decolorationis TaxID=163879 RepID=UPI002147A4FE|nr:helix-turn-helix transcriptional regulator [Pseudalkalibacillus decolorationis]
MSFGDELKKMREQKGLSMRELSRRSGISSSFLSKLESGKRSTPKHETVLKLSDGLGISSVELLEVAGYLNDMDDVLKEMKEEHERKIEIHRQLVEQGFTTSKNPTLVYAIEDIFTDEMLLDYKGQYLTNEEKKEILTFIDYLYEKKNR